VGRTDAVVHRVGGGAAQCDGAPQRRRWCGGRWWMEETPVALGGSVEGEASLNR
jgi:hypothetical protein